MEKHFCTSELFTKAPYPPLTRSPFPKGEGLGGAALCADFCKRRCPKVVTSYSKSLIPAFKLRGSTGSEGSEGSKGSGGGFAAFLEEGILVSSAFPSRGRCPEGADRAQAV